MRAPWWKIAGICSVAALVAAGSWFVFVRTDTARTVTADFAYINGIYPGSPVRVLGVPVGTVDDVTPQGSTVRVTMSISDVTLPAEVNAFVMNPSVISDRFVELGPAYRGGDTLGPNDTIPVDRSHSPINWDQLLDSVNTIASAVGPDGANVGDALSQIASTTAGLGPELHTAIVNVSQATAVLGGSADDIGRLVGSVDRIISALAARDGAVASVTNSLAQLGQEIQRTDLDVGTPTEQLRTLFDQLDELLADRGSEIQATIAHASAVTEQFAAQDDRLAELVDLVPLMMQNIDNTIGDDQRARIRLNISTNLDQFATTAPQCRNAMPLCTGAGFTNPISVPLSVSDPLGLARLLRGGR